MHTLYSDKKMDTIKTLKEKNNIETISLLDAVQA